MFHMKRDKMFHVKEVISNPRLYSLSIVCAILMCSAIVYAQVEEIDTTVVTETYSPVVSTVNLSLDDRSRIDSLVASSSISIEKAIEINENQKNQLEILKELRLQTAYLRSIHRFLTTYNAL